MVLRACRQVHRLLAKRGVIFPPALQIQIDAGAAALHQGLEDVVFERVGFCQRFLGGLQTQAPIGMQAEPAHGEQAVDFVSYLSRRRRTCDHFLEIWTEPARSPDERRAQLRCRNRAMRGPILIGGPQTIQNAQRSRQVVGRLLVTKTFRAALRSLAQIAQRVRKIATVLEMQRERRRDICGSLPIRRPAASRPVRRWICARRPGVSRW